MSNVLVDFGAFKIYWYSFLILVGVTIGIFLAIKEGRRCTLGGTYITDLCFYIIPLAVLGSRLYYVIFNFELYKNNLIDIFKIWEGGLAIYGGIIAAIIFIFYYAKKLEKDPLKTIDVLSASLILGQAIGRWGNFFNQEAYGIETTRELLESSHIPNFIIDNMYINGAYHLPTFYYEFLWCLVGFIILMIIRYFIKNNKIGLQTWTYFIWYGIGRFIIEGLRTDSLYIGIFRVSQIVSIILILIGIIGLIFIRKNNRYIEKKEDENEEI